MEKKTIQSILSSPFALDDWQNLLTAVFGVKNFFQTPSEIPLPNNSKAEAACELGSFNTADDRIIGLYLVKLKPEVWLERNKVGLRELLRSVYKYDVDGALIVFEQAEKWRLSFVSEIRTFDNEGKIIEQKTEPKRYTYLLGKDEKTKTPTDRLFAVAGKKLYLKEILDVFSVEALNKDFYKIVATQFYKLVGATEGKGKKATTYDKVLQLPSVNSGEKKVYQEFAVRLIGRTVFCWFLKKKKSATGKSLLPEHLLSSKAVNENNNYYHSILEKLFFQTLNTPIDKRIDNLPKGCEQIPFLNGGLFEPQSDDYYLPNKFTGDSSHINTLKIPDEWFFELFTNLEQYNFTIDENSIADVEVSVDPEMLGRIFENLLAEIDPDSGESARKATGSYYTPREIVDYMATESLTSYIFTQLQSKNETLTIEQNDLKALFKLDESKDEIAKISNYKIDILIALDNLKILDPACGSGAFPMGMLQKIVMVLQKLDPTSEWWKNKQLEKIENVVFRKQAKEKLEHATVEYAQKIGIIQSSLYGVDIQPIAAEISNLRCFLTLIVDENIDDTKPNRGVEPLPNLEFKFVTADTLQQLPQENDFGGLFNSNDNLNELQKIRLAYLQSYGEEKTDLKDRFIGLQKQTYNKQIKLGGATNLNSKAYTISTWNPFSHKKTDWFDAKWMFGVEKFDVVIGNPPYIKEYTNRAAFDGIRGKKYYQGKMDIWYYFACHLFDSLTESGNLTFIATNNWVTNAGASKMREKIAEDCKIIQFVDFGNTKVFSSADIQTMILIAENGNKPNIYQFGYKCITSDAAELKDAINMLHEIPSEKYTISNQAFDRTILKGKSFVFNSSDNDKLLDRIKAKQNFVLDARKEIAQGIVAPQDFLNGASEKELDYSIPKGTGIFIVTEKERKEIKANKTENQLFKPYFTTEQLSKFYGNNENTTWVIYTTSDFKNPSKMDNYPNIKKHLDQFTNIITSDNKPYGLHRSRDEYFFVGEKIISLRKCAEPTFTFTDFDCYVSQTFFVIKTERINQKYLTALLNSKLIEFWLRYKGKMQGFNFQVDKEPLLEIPIFKPKETKAFEIIVDYLLFILSNKKTINNQVPNSHIASLFEEVIDAMVMELYFKEDFEKVGIAFIKYAERDFESIEGKTEDEQIKTIHNAYQKLREKDNEIRNNLKLMDTRLADIVMPIKNSK